jgi:hypothetical protein
MESAGSILFEKLYRGQVLFRNQQDLVVHIMQQPGTEYYATQDDVEKYNRTLNRLKAYVSQLLSSSVFRIITPGFQEALRGAILKKTGDEELTNKITSQIIDELKLKRNIPPKPDHKLNILEQLTNDFKNGKYISVITSRPLEIEADISNDKFSLRKLIFEDFVDSVLSNQPLKDYRFNFPAESSGILFWKGFNKQLIKYLKNLENRRSFLSAIKEKIHIDLNENVDLFHEPILSDTDIYGTTASILRSLRKECKLVVFTCDAPIYTLPLIVIDPAETRNAKVYAIIDSESDNFNVYKFSNDEIVLWRLFVWDRIISSKYSGAVVEFDSKS